MTHRVKGRADRFSLAASLRARFDMRTNSMIDPFEFQRVFGAEVAGYLPLVDAIVEEAVGTRYRFEPLNIYQRILIEDPVRGMQVYWSEMLGRSHLAAVVSILRHRQWVRSVVESARSDRFMPFAATFRCLIESVADTQDALYQVPLTLAEMAGSIERGLSGHLGDRLVVNQELEDTLIHFSHARQVGASEDAPRTHKRKTARDYLKILERSQVSNVAACYSELCEITHPAADSVKLFLRPHGSATFELRAEPMPELVQAFCATYAEMIGRAPQRCEAAFRRDP